MWGRSQVFPEIADFLDGYFHLSRSNLEYIDSTLSNDPAHTKTALINIIWDIIKTGKDTSFEAVKIMVGFTTLEYFKNDLELADTLTTLRAQANNINSSVKNSLAAIPPLPVAQLITQFTESRGADQDLLDLLNARLNDISIILAENEMTTDFCGDLIFLIDQLRDQDINHTDITLSSANAIVNEIQSLIKHCSKLLLPAGQSHTPMWAARSSAATDARAATEQQVPNMPVVPRTF